MLSRQLTKNLFNKRAASTLAADINAAQDNGRWKGTSTLGGDAKLLIGGSWESSKTDKWSEVLDPSTQHLISKVPHATSAEMKRIVDVAENKFYEWSESSVLTRQRIMLDLQGLIRKYHKDIARNIVLEQGKTFADAMGDVTRGLQVVQMATNIPTELLGRNIEVSRDMDTLTRIEPLGVGAAICPFNFPAMIPLWSVAMAIATGNTLILKPSERDPGASAIIAELCEMAGLPSGVLNILHGGVDAVNFICDEPRIKAISFVGGDKAGKHIYDRAGALGKRVQAQLGAKNHAIILPDANRSALKAVAGAAFGAAGQRCMALSVLVTVGDADWLPVLVEEAKALKMGNGFDEAADLGPVISPQARERIEQLIESCEKQGGRIVLDGRGATVKEYPNGNWVGPTILEATTDMDCYKNEIFGPALVVVKARDLNEAIELVNRNPYGNGAAIFTQSAVSSRKFEKKIEAGQVGVNVPIPVPLPMFSWSGNKASVLGNASLYGPLGLNFWTKTKTITSLWREDAKEDKAAVAMPVHH
ncbi:methylmalonate-semialdehyde dehydrogenase (acylating) [Cryptococcus neoformans var. grubii Br795]|nr:methylmalonate-semialdehyde dehydrogenase (acylating) [Cryptococcus neoformans var. grubii Bt1]OWZ44047.1 methylmalonate-semialdehyde dehydrogenase (acylating) [Cryptococcus neoformans var. grubii AD1-83a]OWZ57611.1 methylmalonate-semialdehyde dehydrogenase (acylating) [Cryptococcus neoformans var. grubii 125.91]OWZ66781.1 methylmalonate-semialdehyde dehydrogenase (acylating) [Cryptococcus neoformans var. grubii]OWZ78430.1 methylmalonate-semialdehyde dehydrogenase (acylating) [Cryptococcus n